MIVWFWVHIQISDRFLRRINVFFFHSYCKRKCITRVIRRIGGGRRMNEKQVFINES